MRKLGHRIVELKVKVSNEITDEQLEYIKNITEGIPVNVGYLSEWGSLGILEKHFGCKGYNSNGQEDEAKNQEGYDYKFENGFLVEHKKMVCNKTSSMAKNLGSNKENKCTHFSFHHPEQNAIYVMKAKDFYKHIALNYDTKCNTYDVAFYTDMKLEGPYKRRDSRVSKNTKALLDYGVKIDL